MRIHGNKYILENQAELNDPAFISIKFSDSYLSIAESSGWRVAIGFQKPNDSNWWEMETDWTWLPKDLRMRLFPGGLTAPLLL